MNFSKINGREFYSGLEEAVKRLNELIVLVHEKKYVASKSAEGASSSSPSSSSQSSSSGAAKSEESTILYKDVDEAVTALSHDILLMQSTVEAHKMQNARDKESYEKKLKGRSVRNRVIHGCGMYTAGCGFFSKS